MKHVFPDLSSLLVRFRWALFLVGVLFAGASLLTTPTVEYDRSVENMFAPDDPLLEPYGRVARTFGGNEVVLAVYEDEDLLAPNGAGIRRLREISRQLRATPGVAEVMSLADLSDALADLQRLQNLLTFRTEQGEAIVDPDNALAARFRACFRGYTHGSDGRTAAVICLLSPVEPTANRRSTEDPRRATVDSLRGKIEQLASGLVAGEPVMVVDGFRYVESDGRRLSWASLLLLSLTIALLFRSVRWVVLPLAVVQLAILLTTGVLGWSQLRLSMVSSMLAAIITVVGVATCVHLIVDYRDSRRAGIAPAEAFRGMYRRLAGPILWSIVTDIIGFASLAVSHVEPVRDYAVMTSLGSALILVSVILVVPALALAVPGNRRPRPTWGDQRLARRLEHSVDWIEHHRALLSGAFAVAAVLAIFGTLRLQVETDFTRNFRRDSPLVAAYNLIETRLGGAGVWEVVLPAPQQLDWSYLERVDRLQTRLRNLNEAGHDETTVKPLMALSLVDAVQSANPRVASLPLAALRDSFVSLTLSAMRAKLPHFTATLHAPDPETGTYYYHILLRAPERLSAERKKNLIHSVRRLAEEEFPEAEVTGYFVLLTHLIDSVLRDQWLAFALAMAGVGVTMSLVFRSVKLAAVALAPNVLPILMVTGLLGWIGLPINLGAAMIAAVSMGLSIDSSIHYIAAFQAARGEGRCVREALQAVQQKVGRAMVCSTLALIVGFTALSVSQFIPTVYFGLLAGLTMFGGMSGNLLLMPLLLGMTVRDDRLELITRPHGPGG